MPRVPRSDQMMQEAGSGVTVVVATSLITTLSIDNVLLPQLSGTPDVETISTVSTFVQFSVNVEKVLLVTFNTAESTIVPPRNPSRVKLRFAPDLRSKLMKSNG